jgi:hypothetical protein
MCSGGRRLLAFFCAGAVWLFRKPEHLEQRAGAH